MNFDWDENKRRSNLLKHRVDFVDAMGVFYDDHAITVEDPDVIQWFKDRVKNGGNYQSLMNETLRQHVECQGEPLEVTLRRVIREEIHATG